MVLSIIKNGSSISSWHKSNSLFGFPCHLCCDCVLIDLFMIRKTERYGGTVSKPDRFNTRGNPTKCTTLESESKVPFPRQLHHPISLASFILKGWNLVCGTPWPNPTLTNFQSIWISSSLEIWKICDFFPHFEKEGKMERREKWQLWQKWQPAAQATTAKSVEPIQIWCTIIFEPKMQIPSQCTLSPSL